MSEEHEWLRESASRALVGALNDVPREQAGRRAWSALETAGMTLVGVPEAAGGSGGAPEDAAAVLAAVAEQGAPVPLAETAWLASWLLRECGQQVPSGPLTAACPPTTTLEIRREANGLIVSGPLDRVPYAGLSERLILLLPLDQRPVVAAIDLAAAKIEGGQNLAGEPRDHVLLEAVRVATADLYEPRDSVGPEEFRRRAAAARVIQLAGASRQALALTIRHVSERVQFGRSLARFQGVQNRVATMAGEVRVLEAASDLAVSGLGRAGPAAALNVASAVVAAYDSAGIVSSNAHQLFGAMGFTREHALHRATTALWSWRQELGPLRGWLAEISGLTAQDGDGLWAELTTHEWTS